VTDRTPAVMLGCRTGTVAAGQGLSARPGPGGIADSRHAAPPGDRDPRAGLRSLTSASPLMPALPRTS